MRVYNFNDVVGNVSSVSIIQQSLQNGTFPHISIFSGLHGTGKSTCAEIAGLYLTCDNPINGNPCLKCPQCQATLKALQNTGVSNRVSKINVGRIMDKSSMEVLIRDIFDLQISDKNVVYIIEEAHAFNDLQQTTLLEEIDRLSSNVYIIFCTTKPTKIIKELRSRALPFNFTRLNNSEASVLFELQCKKMNISVRDNEIKEMILQYGRGVPRTIVNLLEFICSNEFETKTVAEFLGIIDEDTFLLLFEAMRVSDLFTMISTLDDILAKHTKDVLIEQLKDFILRVLFLIEGGIVDGFNVSELERIHNVFDGFDTTTIANVIESIKYNATESELKFKLLKVRQMLNNSSIENIVRENKIAAVKQNNLAKNLVEERNSFERSGDGVQLQQLDINYLMNL